MKKLSIQQRLLRTSLVPVMIILLTSIFTAYEFLQTRNSLIYSSNVGNPLNAAVDEIKIELNGMARYLWSTFVCFKQCSNEAYDLNRKLYEKGIQELEEALKRFEVLGSYLPPEQVAHLSQVRKIWSESEEHFKMIGSYYREKSPEKINAIVDLSIKELRPKLSEMSKELDGLDEYIMATSRAKMAEDVASAGRSIWFVLGASLISIILTLFLGSRSAKSFAQELFEIAFALVEDASQVRTMATTLSSASQKLSSAATEQAASLQQTAASLEELNAMIGKNSNNTKKSREESEECLSIASSGHDEVNKLREAVEAIDSQNVEFSRAMQENNLKIEGMIHVVQSIAEKTKAINDIVFQTKLLSFNASVEAARAGEHGNGFAVVAEEVGSLAVKSGTSAKEIEEILQKSEEEVLAVVNANRSTVEKMIASYSQKTKMCRDVTIQTSQALKQIVSQTSTVSALITDIAQATSEQATGVSEISKAMHQLDQVALENTGSSAQISGSAENLLSQSTQMDTSAQKLQNFILGEGNPGHHRV